MKVQEAAELYMQRDNSVMISLRGLILMNNFAKIRISLLVAFISLLGFLPEVNAQGTQAPTISKMYGEIALQTNYVDRGLTQSNKSMSIDAGVGYWFGGQGRIGFNATSVSFVNESANSEIRAFGEYKFVFSGNSDLKLRNDVIRYFSEDKRNNTLITLDQNFFGYHLLFKRDDNFEGTKTHRNWFGFHRDWPLGTSVQLNTTFGYSILEIAGFNNYFDSRVGLSYLTSNLTLSLIGTTTSAPSQFNGTADTFVFFVVAAKF
jgi:uncharacterized protein (TIGR02001 family)